MHGVTTATELSRRQGRARERLDAESMEGSAEADGDKHMPLRVLSGEEVTETRDSHSDIKNNN